MWVDFKQRRAVKTGYPLRMSLTGWVTFPFPKVQSELGCSSLRSVGTGLYIHPCRAMLGLLGNLLSTIVQKGFFESGKGRIQTMNLELCLESFSSVGSLHPHLLTCGCWEPVLPQCGLDGLWVTKTIDVHISTGTYIPNPCAFFSDIQIRDTSEIQKMLIEFFQNWECFLSIMWRSPKVVLLNGKEYYNSHYGFVYEQGKCYFQSNYLDSYKFERDYVVWKHKGALQRWWCLWLCRVGELEPSPAVLSTTVSHQCTLIWWKMVGVFYLIPVTTAMGQASWEQASMSLFSLQY